MSQRRTRRADHRTIRVGGVVASIFAVVAICFAAQVPNSFVVGTVASADEVNQNFQYLADRAWELGTNSVHHMGQVGIGKNDPGTALDVVGTVKATRFEGPVVPAGFVQTNGVVHTAAEQAADIHGTAARNCAGMGGHICDHAEYAKAVLGTVDETNPLADDHLYWNGSTAWNHVNDCNNASCTIGGSVEAGSHTGNAYTLVGLTPCADRCTRALKYYCCR